jgi:hypothetical protein
MNAKLIVRICALSFICVARVSAQVAVVSNTVEERAAAAGEQYNGSIVLRNTSDAAQSVEAYVTDYAFTANGQTSYAVAGTAARSSGLWIQLHPERLSLPPHGEGVITYTVNVPQRNDMRGTYWSMIMVQALVKAAENSSGLSGNDRARIGIKPVIRYGVQVVTHMTGAGSRDVAIEGAALVATGTNGRLLQFDVVNTGERAYRPKLTAELYGEDGKLAAHFETMRGLVYPGSSVRQAYALPQLPHGSYKAMVITDTGADRLFAQQYRLNF